MAAASLLLLVYTAANLDWCWDMLSKPVASASMMMRPCQTYILPLFFGIFAIPFWKPKWTQQRWHVLTYLPKMGKMHELQKCVCLKKIAFFSWKHAIKWKQTHPFRERTEKSIWWLGQIVRLVCLSLGKIFGVLDSRDREEWAFKPFHIPFYYLFTTGEEVYCQAVFL